MTTKTTKTLCYEYHGDENVSHLLHFIMKPIYRINRPWIRTAYQIRTNTHKRGAVFLVQYRDVVFERALPGSVQTPKVGKLCKKGTRNVPEAGSQCIAQEEEDGDGEDTIEQGKPGHDERVDEPGKPRQAKVRTEVSGEMIVKEWQGNVSSRAVLLSIYQACKYEANSM